MYRNLSSIIAQFVTQSCLYLIDTRYGLDAPFLCHLTDTILGVGYRNK